MKLALRLLDEKLTLHGNMVALDKFLAEPENLKELNPKEISLMCTQLEGMKMYYGALNIRCYYHANDRTFPVSNK